MHKKEFSKGSCRLLVTPLDTQITIFGSDGSSVAVVLHEQTFFIGLYYSLTVGSWRQAISDCAGGGSGLVELCLPGRWMDDLKNDLSVATAQRARISILCHPHGRMAWKASYQLIFERGCASSSTPRKVRSLRWSHLCCC